ncbi:regulatory iron-sulfur-containing complex subunit RicT [Streptococcus castoreus]|uniref:regulatory iron-sulfur-containing complex subunit RicT n=1 Tax=Streptococcus castoreus TaxID=254786 RepID=UPI00041485F6|nr:regulatory iron-sulfur-containing complex subunit RicT [Streptococcus castoreus]
MISVIGIHYGETEFVKYARTEHDFPKGALVVAKGSKGSHLVKVCQTRKNFSEDKLPKDLPIVLRHATEMDKRAYEQNIKFASAAKDQVLTLIAQNGLEMKLIDIVFPLERHYVLITFSAEDRVDFRQLLKDLAAYFKMRIELHQINSREEAKVYGGLGPCGRPLCCSSFLGEFPPVSIKMLKNQGLSLNFGKSIGYCGRLLCCLHYEDSFYQESKKKFPDYGTIVETANGSATVVAIDIFTGTIKVRFSNQVALTTYALEEVKVGE